MLKQSKVSLVISDPTFSATFSQELVSLLVLETSPPIATTAKSNDQFPRVDLGSAKEKSQQHTPPYHCLHPASWNSLNQMSSKVWHHTRRNSYVTCEFIPDVALQLMNRTRFSV
ncbi:hypothetical protein H5410_000072 [Solanum commersonii]|uniref:Uncharacterized protein n=1 Tax=Solanum commersonii TaxID=4109 RepID=A0A9J6AVS6_SOLCO|nr:hypothetical protein H5410_000072 [Solanum commersonii]